MGEYEEEDQRTEEEMAADYQLYLHWTDLNNAWEAADRKCACGKPITLEEAFFFGRCTECLAEDVSF